MTVMPVASENSLMMVGNHLSRGVIGNGRFQAAMVAETVAPNRGQPGMASQRGLV